VAAVRRLSLLIYLFFLWLNHNSWQRSGGQALSYGRTVLNNLVDILLTAAALGD
jgi:hypothetical protein